MSTPNEQFRAFEAEQIKKGVTGLTNSVAMKTHPCTRLTKHIAPRATPPKGELGLIVSTQLPPVSAKEPDKKRM